MNNDKITISSIATSLGVSNMSVSRALSGQTGVSDNLRNKILEKAKELNYIKCKKNTDINILILHARPLLDDGSNYNRRVQGIEKLLQKMNIEYSLQYVDKENQDKFSLPYKLSKGLHYDGIILLGKFNSKYVDFMGKKFNNLVIFAGYSPCYDYDSVWFNFNNSGYKQCEYLIKNGHKDIAYIGDMSSFRNKEILLGITTALEDYKISVQQNFFIDMRESYKDKITDLINSSNRPTAIICAVDTAALELIGIFHNIGIRVPEDISLISTGNTEMSTLAVPKLTSMALNNEYSCELVVNLLIKRINYSSKPKENIAVNPTLIERASVKNIELNHLTRGDAIEE